jgi:hypothetical protein
MYAAAGIVGLVYFFITSVKAGSRDQDVRSFLFYRKYCDTNGELKDIYLKKIKADG